MRNTTINSGSLRRFAVIAALSGASFLSFGQAIIDNGFVQLGVDVNGQLNIGGGSSSQSGVSVVGLRLLNVPDPSFESTAPGCLCEGWGVGYVLPTQQSGFANNDDGTSNLTSIGFASTPTSATTVSSMGGNLEVTHAFTPSVNTPYLYQVAVTIKNTSGGAIQDLRYTRTMDWDVEPTPFDEYVTIQGTGSTSTLLHSNDNGFESSDPFAGRSEIMSGTTDVDFADFGIDDHGANFDFGFGDLLDGDSFSFKIFYGAAPTEAAALAAIGADGLELFSLGQSANGPETGAPATFIFGFKGVGGVVQVDVPEPGTYAAGAMVLGLAGLTYLRRRQS